MMKRKVFIAAGVLASALLLWTGGHSQEYDTAARVESKRKDRVLTLRFERAPEAGAYLMLESGRVIGSVEITEVRPVQRGGAVFHLARAAYLLNSSRDEELIRAGLEIGIRKKGDLRERSFPEPGKAPPAPYRKEILPAVDRRVMVLIPAGKFVFGSNTGERDERPEQEIFLPDFYMDKYEVSNADYLAFVRAANAKPPRSWAGGMYPGGEEEFPVTVSYHEAEVFARWAGKRLPSEMEWEKAARGAGYEPGPGGEAGPAFVERPRVYPWGDRFDAARANSADFWGAANAGLEIKKTRAKGLLPVGSFDGQGESPYGVADMAGNAQEWTSSWYRAYPGNTYRHKLFGTQVKVLRGGSYLDGGPGLRSTRRQIGGLPNLYDDPIGGFRCLKEPTVIDRMDEGK